MSEKLAKLTKADLIKLIEELREEIDPEYLSENARNALGFEQDYDVSLGVDIHMTDISEHPHNISGQNFEVKVFYKGTQQEVCGVAVNDIDY